MSDELLRAHNRRLAELDSLVAPAKPAPEPGEEDAELAVDGGVGLARLIRPDADSESALWMSLETHQLTARVTGPSAMARLLDAWDAHVHDRAIPDQPDSEARLLWPSRDTAMVLLFKRHRLIPATVIAARPAGRPMPNSATPVKVRPLEPADVPAATRMYLDVTVWDNQFRGTPQRSGAEDLLRASLESAFDGRLWAWTAEDNGELVGMVTVSPPERSEWVQPLVAAAPAAYLPAMVVTADRRSDGIGTALVAAAHNALDAAGIPMTLLHYAALSPLSGPFWHRCGYRPLWTTWYRQPAVGR